MRRFPVLLILAAVSCGGDSSTSPPASVAGSYTLRTVNASPLPWIASRNGADTWEVVSDVRILTDSGTYTESGTNRFTENGQVTTSDFEVSGTYTLTGAGITFVRASNETESGTVGDGTLVIRAQGIITPVVAVYQR